MFLRTNNGTAIISRGPQKYALVWKMFFTKDGDGANVNIYAILLDEPS